MLFFVNITPELFDEFDIDLVEAFPTVTVVVEADNEKEASKAAASWHGDNSKVMMTGEDDYRQNYGITTAKPSGDAGHFIYIKDKHIRYTCVKVMKTNQEEVDFFFSVTSGLTNGMIKGKSQE